MSANWQILSSFIEEMGITHEDVLRRKEYLEFTEQDANILRTVHEYLAIEDKEEFFTEAFYTHLLSFQELDSFLASDERIARLKITQANYFRRLTAGNYGYEYVMDRLKVGFVHQQVGLDPKWYIGAYRKYLSALIPLLKKMGGQDEAAYENAYNAIVKVIFFDMGLALETYFHATQAQLHHSANYDALTGLPNRNLFTDRLNQEIMLANREGYSFVLMLLDLDQFKEVNDTLGHDVGDLLLQEAARRIRNSVRESDTVARLGGDEFTIILPKLDDEQDVNNLASKLIGSLEKAFIVGNECIYVTASVGITRYPVDACNRSSLIKNADQALYQSKNNGRNRYSHFTPILQETANYRLHLTADLRGALQAKQFEVYFQPVVELSTGHIHKAEALLRWHHPERGMVSPKDFIPLAEETGLICEIGDWVFRESVRQANQWRKKFDCRFQISFNKSPAQFRNSKGVVASKWPEYLRDRKIPGDCVVVEITEGLLLDAAAEISQRLLQLRNSGMQVAIDDFGTGYSSLSYLKRLDIDYLKIDKSFVDNLATDKNDQVLCEAIVVMAHKLGIKVIAEGVESSAQMEILKAAGCDYAQGYLFSRPVPSGEFESLLRPVWPGQLAAI